jgi:acid stress-induced BolA-like protein IbaG/YrbA
MQRGYRKPVLHRLQRWFRIAFQINHHNACHRLERMGRFSELRCPVTVLQFASKIMNAAQVRSLIQAGLPGAQVQVASDDDTHFEALIVAGHFAGKRMLQRHQLVYASLGQLMGREIHALSIQAYTPEEWAAAPNRTASFPG